MVILRENEITSRSIINGKLIFWDFRLAKRAIERAIFQATALSDEEFAAFKCRPGQYYQYGVSDGGQGHAVDWNEYASASNNYAGCFPDMRLPCKRTDNVCKMETDWYAGRVGAMHQFTMNSIPGKTQES